MDLGQNRSADLSRVGASEPGYSPFMIDAGLGEAHVLARAAG
jgi:hypothetical protein